MDPSPQTEIEYLRRRVAELERAVSENHPASLLGPSPVPAILTSLDRIAFVNDAAVNTLGGRTAEEIAGVSPLVWIHPSCHEVAVDRMKKALHARSPMPVAEERFVRADGTDIEVDVVRWPVPYRGGTALIVTFLDVTARRRAEQRLRRSEEFSRRILESSRDCIKVLDLESTILTMSAGGLSAFEVDDEALVLGRSWLAFWEGNDRQAAERAFERARAGGVGGFEGYCPTMTGKPRWWSVVVSPITGEDGRTERLLCISRDVTERKRADEALRASEERFRAMVSLAIVGIVQVDLTGRFLLVNDRFCSITGRDRDELLSLRVEDITHPDDLDATRSLMAHMMNTGIPFVTEKRYMRPDGSVVWSSTSVSVVLGSDGKPTSIVAVAVDVTERKEAERELLENRQQVDAVLASSPLPIVALTSDGNITLWNPAAERLFGWSAEEVMGKPLPFIPEEKREEHKEMRKRDLSGQGFTNRLIRRRRKDGTPIDLNVSTAPLRDESGRVIGIMSMYVDVTEQRRMESSLRDSEAKFRGLIEQSPLSILVISADGRAVSANKAWEKLWGISSANVTDFDALAVLETNREVLPYLLRARNGETVEIPEFPFVPDRGQREGQEIWVRAYAYPVRDTKGAVREVVIVQEDVTARRRAEQRLRESEARFRTLFDVARDAIGVAAGNQHAYVNRSYATLFGYSDPAELAGMPILAVIAPSAREQMIKMRRRRQAGEPAPEAYITRGLRRDGTEFDASMRVTSYVNDGVFYTLATIRDVTAERAAQEELSRSAERYRVFVAQSLDGVWRFEHDQFINTSWPEERQIDALFNWAWVAECNDAKARMYGYERAEELTGKRIGDLLDRNDPQVLDMLHGYIQSGYRLANVETVERDRHGNTRRLLNSMVGVVEDGHLIRTWSVQRDITERKRFEEDLTAANEELRRANAELEEFAYVASHDLQEPLRMVNIYTQLLLRRVNSDDPEVHQCAAVVREGVVRMEDLIRDLLSYSRIIHPNGEPADVADLSDSFSQAIEMLRGRIEETGASISAMPLPSVRGDTRQFSLVFQNLLSNSLKYHRTDVAPEIRIAAEQADNQWIVSVSDNGIGFQQQYADRIFGLFKRLHRDEYPGTGLGLAICQRIVERYGGRIWAEGRPGEGATFYISLPRPDSSHYSS